MLKKVIKMIKKFVKKINKHKKLFIALFLSLAYLLCFSVIALSVLDIKNHLKSINELTTVCQVEIDY